MKSARKIGFKLFLKAILASLALISGGIFYAVFRASEVIFSKITYSLSDAFNINKLDCPFQLLNNEPPDWVIYSLHYSLWVCTYVLLMTTLKSVIPSQIKKQGIVGIPILTIRSELLQHFGKFPGTCCILAFCPRNTGFSTGCLIKSNKLKFSNNENEP